MTLSVCIVDDEVDAQNVLISLIEKSSHEIELLGVASTFAEAKTLIEDKEPKMVFLDINLGEKSGLELARSIDTTKTSIIFVTAYDNHVLEALRIKAFDYLYKPVFLPDFNEMIERYLNDQNHLKKFEQEEATIVVANNDGQHVIKMSDVEFIEAAGAYCTFNLLTSEKIMVSKPLKSFVPKFNETSGFVRTHKSFLVNTNCISKVFYGENYLLLTSGKNVVISRNKKSHVKQILDKIMNEQ